MQPTQKSLCACVRPRAFASRNRVQQVYVGICRCRCRCYFVADHRPQPHLHGTHRPALQPAVALHVQRRGRGRPCLRAASRPSGGRRSGGDGGRHGVWRADGLDRGEGAPCDSGSGRGGIEALLQARQNLFRPRRRCRVGHGGSSNFCFSQVWRVVNRTGGGLMSIRLDKTAFLLHRGQLSQASRRMFGRVARLPFSLL